MIREGSSTEWEIKQEKIKKDMSGHMKAEYKSIALAHPEMNERGILRYPEHVILERKRLWVGFHVREH